MLLKISFLCNYTAIFIKSASQKLAFLNSFWDFLKNFALTLYSQSAVPWKLPYIVGYLHSFWSLDGTSPTSD